MADGWRATLVAGDLALHFDLRQGARVTAVTHAGVPGRAGGAGGAGAGGLVERWWCGYTADDRTWSDAPLPGEVPFGAAPGRLRRGGRSGREEVRARLATPHLRVQQRFTTYPGLPFVRIRYRVETTGVRGCGPGLSLALPGLRFGPHLALPFSLRVDTADDGGDLGGGLTLPAWRAFADPQEQFGLLVFSAERGTMSRLQLTERGCAFRPPYYLAYSTEVGTTHELRLGLGEQNYGPLDEVDWFLGAYRRETLPQLRQRIAGFHARRRPGEWGGAAGAQAGEPGEWRGEVLEVSPEAPPHILPPLEALPPPWPGRVSLLTPPEGGPGPAPAERRRYVWAGGAAEVRFVARAGTPLGSYRVGLSLPGAAGGAERAEGSGARIEVDVEVATPAPLSGALGAPGETVIGAAALVAGGLPAGWRLVRSVGAPGGHALLAGPGGAPGSDLRIDPGLAGPHDVWAGLAGGVGLKLRLDGDPYWTYLTADPEADVQLWRPVESLCQGRREARIRRAVLDGRGLTLAPHPNVQGYTVLTHVRFAPSPAPDPLPALHGRRRTLAGLADTPDVSFEVAADSFREEAWRESLWQHAAHGIDTVYWRVDGQCSDFHTRVGTVRYSVPRTHSLYSPASRYFGLALERLDPLRIAVEESRRWGLRLFGWMRANNYSGNVVARFFVQHPEWHEARADGSPAPQLCFAVPEVRGHKIAILREAAGYGLDGLLIDTLRHPPMVGYHPAVTGAYRERFGEEPPRSLEAPVFLERGDGRGGQPWDRWFRFRATFFSAFLRELRVALQGDGLGHLPLHVRVAPRRALHDGADLEALLDEGLIDAVVANRYETEPLDYERLFPLVRGRVPVVAVCDPLRGDPIDHLLDLQGDERLGGAGLYESEWSVHIPAHREVLLACAARAG